jgi:hypothetical protein
VRIAANHERVAVGLVRGFEQRVLDGADGDADRNIEADAALKLGDALAGPPPSAGSFSAACECTGFLGVRDSRRSQSPSELFVRLPRMPVALLGMACIYAFPPFRKAR